MRSMSIALMAVLCAVACSGSAHLVPEPVLSEIPALPWPTTRVTVLDERTNHGAAHDALVQAIVRTLAQAVPPGVEQDLEIRVLVHDAAFQGGGSPWWIGRTELVATVRRTGTVLATWRAQDTHLEWNTLGYKSGTRAGQASLRDALRKLLRTVPQLPAR